MKKTLRILLLLTSTLLSARTAPSESARPPNLIYILADDLGYGDLGCYGQQKFATPNIDRMAREGMRFTSFYSGNTVCAPSRSALLTGQHTGHTPVRGNAEVFPEGQEPLPAAAITIPEVLHGAGYVSGAFGKWGLGFVGSEGDPLKQVWVTKTPSGSRVEKFRGIFREDRGASCPSRDAL
jgi:arylsulfatase A-like enzyme